MAPTRRSGPSARSGSGAEWTVRFDGSVDRTRAYDRRMVGEEADVSERGSKGIAGLSVDPADVVDVFVYVVVLNLATQFAPQVITESFTTSLLLALLLKLVLEVVLALKRRAKERFVAAPNRAGKVVSAAMLLVLLPGSKFVVIELVAFVFGDAVQLGGFFLVTGLVLALMLARWSVRWLLGASPVATGVGGAARH